MSSSNTLLNFKVLLWHLGRHREGSTSLSPSPWPSFHSPEKPRTFTQREKNFTMKIFTFQFFTHFSSLIYIAFFLGR